MMVLDMENLKKSALRKIYGQTLINLGQENKDIVVLDADTACSTQTKMFADKFPERFFNIGISEQDAMSTAAGLSVYGKVPFVSMFAIFATGRTYDQIRNSICYPNFNVKIVSTHGGITVGEDGATHQALEDINLMRGLPNMTVIVPSDKAETIAAIKFAAEYKGPVYVRLNRSPVPDIFDETTYKFDFPKAQVIKEGSDVTLFSNGETLFEVIKCAKILEEKAINAEIVNVPVVKPLDEDTVIRSTVKTKAAVVVENHSIIGGLGSAIAECLCENNPVILKRVGTKDVFGQSGKAQDVFEEYGLNAESFVDEVIKIVGKKK